MRLVDTSAWIEKFAGTPLGLRLDQEFPRADECVVPTLVQLELAKWLTRERSANLARRVIAYTRFCIVVPLDTRLALQAADLCRRHKLATADAAIYATALATSAELLTCDAHFEGLPSVLYFPKQSQE